MLSSARQATARMGSQASLNVGLIVLPDVALQLCIQGCVFKAVYPFQRQ